MKATEIIKKLGEISDSLADDEQKEAIGVAIRAINYCSRMYIIE